MADNQAGTAAPDGWMGDVQRALALLIIGILCFAAAGLVIRLIITGPIDDITDLAKIMLAALVNMALIALGFFFGSSKSKENADTAQASLIDKLTPAPVAPAPTPVAPWWGKLTEEEKNAITAAGPADPRVAAIISAMQVGAATPDDIAYLVTKNLLAQGRVSAIQAA